MKAVLFDLDGTLLDTAADLSAALNAVLISRQKKPLPLEATRPFAGTGSTGLIKFGFDIPEDDPDFSALRQDFFKHYEAKLLDKTNLFPGMAVVLFFLKKNNIPWGIVTNKIQRYTQSLVNFFPLLQAAQCIICGDSLKVRKPHPEPLLKACEILHIKPFECFYIGDALDDAKAAAAANMPFITALYGFCQDRKAALAWTAYARIEKPEELLEIFKQCHASESWHPERPN